MLKSALYVLFFVLSATGLAAQKNSPPDKVTLSDGTTFNAHVQRGAGFYTGKKVGIRKAGAEGFRQYSPTGVREFTSGHGRKTYRSVEVDIPNQNKGGVRVRQRRFGEVLADGAVQLIRINLGTDEYENTAVGIEPYMYLLREGDVELALEMTTIMVYEILNANPSRFRNKLKFFAGDCADAHRFAEEARFNDGDLLRVVNDYVKCKQLTGVSLNESKVSSRLRLHHFGRIGVLDLRDENYNDRQLSASIGYQGEAAFTNKMQWLGVLTSVEYVYQSFRWEDRANVQQSMAKVNLSLAVKPVQRDNFSLQLTGGLSSYNATSSSFNSFFNNNYFLLSGGLRLRSHNYLFGISYERMPNHIREQPGNILLLSAGYRFGGR